MNENQFDPVTRPAHYCYSDIEPIVAIEAWKLNYALGCVVKYVARHKHKGKFLEDLKKARFYLDHEIAAREKTEELLSEAAKEVDQIIQDEKDTRDASQADIAATGFIEREYPIGIRVDI